MNKILTLIPALLCTVFTIAQAQVQFKLDYLPKQDAYQVSMISQATWQSPMNMTGTGQVTIKVPTGQFEVSNLNFLQPDVRWEANSTQIAPMEAPEFDYISFGLMSFGTKGIEYTAGKEVPLFTFQNAMGCTGTIQLIDNNTDVFMAPNSRSANVGNQLSVFGAGGNAWTGNAGDGSAKCGNIQTSAVHMADKKKVRSFDLKFYPNPVQEVMNVLVPADEDLEEVTLSIFDADGKLVMIQKKDMVAGANNLQVNVATLPSGNYYAELRTSDDTAKTKEFIKI